MVGCASKRIQELIGGVAKSCSAWTTFPLLVVVPNVGLQLMLNVTVVACAGPTDACHVTGTLDLNCRP